MRLDFTVNGPPKPWQRTQGKGGKRFKAQETRRYQRFVGYAALAVRGAQVPAWPLDARYRMHVHAFFGDRRRRDIDNVSKQLMDALNGVLWDDDSQVDELFVKRHVDREEPRAEVTVEVMS